MREKKKKRRHPRLIVTNVTFTTCERKRKTSIRGPRFLFSLFFFFTGRRVSLARSFTRAPHDLWVFIPRAANPFTQYFIPSTKSFHLDNRAPEHKQPATCSHAPVLFFFFFSQHVVSHSCARRIYGRRKSRARTDSGGRGHSGTEKGNFIHCRKSEY